MPDQKLHREDPTPAITEMPTRKAWDILFALLDKETAAIRRLGGTI